ncbi:MAG: FKBP-type peptidyl-prolyl cis-trans isomerase [Chitinophagaceae bacterium]|nr:FKBP-type peptidyl-prolyl cis-trans isomerase [Chitinophagaceae bacterium]
MKKLLLSTLLIAASTTGRAADKDSTINYLLPDSVKAVSFLADVEVRAVKGRKEVITGIQTDMVRLYLETEKDEKEVVFEFPDDAVVAAKGKDVDPDEKGELEWEYNWSLNEVYKLLIATANDSAGNFAVYSGYIFLPKENKWKLIGTCRISGQWRTIQQPSFFYSAGKKNAADAVSSQVWCQRNNGSWKNMLNTESKSPMVNLMSHMDSISQYQTERAFIEKAIADGTTDAKENAEGIYYTILKEGTGRQVSVDDTVTVYYKGYLFANGAVFDQTKEKPATFPLKRLIRGWQIGIPLCKAGGKIKLVIPSALAYSIRTRAAKIPPNSILVFEIEVLDAKAPTQ